MLDGSSYYYPVYKEHWWSSWKSLYSYCCSCKLVHTNIDSAKQDIKLFKEIYLNSTVDHSYDVYIKEE